MHEPFLITATATDLLAHSFLSVLDPCPHAIQTLIANELHPQGLYEACHAVALRALSSANLVAPDTTLDIEYACTRPSHVFPGADDLLVLAGNVPAGDWLIRARVRRLQ